MDSFIRDVKDALSKRTGTDTEFLATSTLTITALLRAFMDMLPDPRFGPPNVGLTCALCDANSQDVHLAGHVDDCNFAHYLAGPPADVPDEPMPKYQMVHLQAMKAELTDKLKVLVSEYKKDDNATATMLAFNRQAKAASNEGLKCGCPLVYLPRDCTPYPRRVAEPNAQRCVSYSPRSQAVRSSLRCNLQRCNLQRCNLQRCNLQRYNLQRYNLCNLLQLRICSGYSARIARSGGSLCLVRRPGKASSSAK